MSQEATVFSLTHYVSLCNYAHCADELCGKMMSQRAFYSINDDVLSRFNALVPARKRSQTMQKLMAQHVASFEAKIARAAALIANDPDFAALAGVSGDADNWTFETLTTLESHELKSNE
jgi:hypothetical protein